ncbi:MAG: hypothetical protein HYU56_02795 [Candidatus Aenigmarchaeota archaeon]|nr:hypothetical protein [Candidatus Aenigmarchaeota archaeon]
MKKRSLQEIEDYYKKQDYVGEKLRKKVIEDKQYQKLLKERQKQLTKRFPLTKTEKLKYVMSTNQDYEILEKVKQLEKLKLSKQEEILVKLMKTQLEYGWRKYLIQELNKLMKKREVPIDQNAFK